MILEYVSRNEGRKKKKRKIRRGEGAYNRPALCGADHGKTYKDTAAMMKTGREVRGNNENGRMRMGQSERRE